MNASGEQRESYVGSRRMDEVLRVALQRRRGTGVITDVDLAHIG